LRVNREALLPRAAASFSAVPRGFIRWAGSKRSLLPEIVSRLPDEFGRYYEPFFGSGSLFFLIQPRRARLSDACGELMRTYQAVASSAEKVLTHLSSWAPNRDFYYEIRDVDAGQPDYLAARFIYLNKACWNGLYRVNGDGRFNVPYGRPKTDGLIDANNLRACSEALARTGVSLTHGDFQKQLRYAREGDFAFLDPPYVTRHNNNGFIEYNEQIFSWKDQQRLADVAHELVNKGVKVMITNALHGDVLDLYRGFQHVAVVRASTLASDKTKRGRVEEAIIWSYPES
jgi:DNA adenine methylase